MGKGRIPLMPESAVLAGSLAYLAMIGVKATRHNVMVAVNPNGPRVRCGRPGDPDIAGTLPDGRTLGIECKREGFDPRRLNSSQRIHFNRQVEAMRAINATNGVAFWIDDPKILADVMPTILAGGRVVEEGDGCLVITSKERDE